MRLPLEIRKQFRAFGRSGGKKRAASMTAESRRAVARQAALRRWTRARFGVTSFEALGLPGGDIVDRGLMSLAEGKETPESLVISEAAPRLRREGVPLPGEVFHDAARRLYELIERDSGDLAHARYLAYLERVASFADAVSSVRIDRQRRA